MTSSTQKLEIMTSIQSNLAKNIWSYSQFLLVMAIVVYAVVLGGQNLGYNWQWYRVPKFIYRVTEEGLIWGPLATGLVNTIVLSAIAFGMSIFGGLAISLVRLSNSIVGMAASNIYLEIVRNSPILVLLYVFYYVFGPIFELNRYWASILCLAFYHAAFVSEIIRAGILSVNKGQWEAASAIGMSTAQSYQSVILPQAIRIMLPPMTGEAISMIKHSAIVSVIAVAELTTMGRNIISDTYMSFEIWFTVAAIYLAITLILSVVVSILEKKYSITER